VLRLICVIGAIDYNKIAIPIKLRKMQKLEYKLYNQTGTDIPTLPDQTYDTGGLVTINTDKELNST
jgi:hypothetical protein